MSVKRRALAKENPTYINTTLHSCNCWGNCRCWRPQPQPTWWCSQCCCYTYYQHYHPVICYDFGRDEALREEGRRQERARRHHKRQPGLPYVDVTPALPRYRW